MATHRNKALQHPCIIQHSLTQCPRPGCMAPLPPGAQCTGRPTAASRGARRPRGGCAEGRGRGRGIFPVISNSDPHSEFYLRLCTSVHSGYVNQYSRFQYTELDFVFQGGYRIMSLAPFLISHFSFYFFPKALAGFSSSRPWSLL